MQFGRSLLAFAAVGAVVATVSCDDFFAGFGFPQFSRTEFPRFNFPKIEIPPIPAIDPAQIPNLKPGPGGHVSGFSYVSHAGSDGSGSTLVTNTDGDVKVYRTGDHAADKGAKTPEIPAIPEIPVIPKISPIPEIPAIPEIPPDQEIPAIPKISPIINIPSVPQIPDIDIPAFDIDAEELQNLKPGPGQHVSGWSYVARTDNTGSGSTLVTNTNGDVKEYKTGHHADEH